MTAEEEKNIIKELRHIREDYYVLEAMLKNTGQNLNKAEELAADAKNKVDKIIFDLTGEDIYRQRKPEGDINDFK